MNKDITPLTGGGTTREVVSNPYTVNEVEYDLTVSGFCETEIIETTPQISLNSFTVDDDFINLVERGDFYTPNISITDSNGNNLNNKFTYSATLDNVELEMESKNSPNFKLTLQKPTGFVELAINDESEKYVLDHDKDNNPLFETSTSFNIEKRKITLVSGGGTKTYDGTYLTNGTVRLIGDGLMRPGDIIYRATGKQKEVGSSFNTIEVEYCSDYIKNFYEITFELGTLAVYAAPVTPP